MNTSKGNAPKSTKSGRIAPPWLWLLLIFMACALGAIKIHLSRPIDEAQLANEAQQRAITALNELDPAFTAPQLVSALNLGVINFATGSAVIPVERHKLLDKSADAIKRAPKGTLLEIEGHADITGDPDRNRELSVSRAHAIAYYLISKGVNPRIIVAKGYGSTKPIADNQTEMGRFKNRRIEYRTQ